VNAPFADDKITRLITELRTMAGHGENCRADNLTATEAADALEQQERFLEKRYEDVIPDVMVNVINEYGDKIKRVTALVDSWGMATVITGNPRSEAMRKLVEELREALG